MNTTTIAVHQTWRPQGVGLALATAQALSALRSGVAAWLAARAAQADLRIELTALSPTDARDLGIDAALLRQAGSFASSTHWIHH